MAGQRFLRLLMNHGAMTLSPRCHFSLAQYASIKFCDFGKVIGWENLLFCVGIDGLEI
jgi:hypothetical protein